MQGLLFLYTDISPHLCVSTAQFLKYFRTELLISFLNLFFVFFTASVCRDYCLSAFCIHIVGMDNQVQHWSTFFVFICSIQVCSVFTKSLLNRWNQLSQRGLNLESVWHKSVAKNGKKFSSEILCMPPCFRHGEFLFLEHLAAALFMYCSLVGSMLVFDLIYLCQPYKFLS